MLYVLFVQIYFCLPENSDANRMLTADISSLSNNTRTLLLKLAKASFFFFKLVICAEGLSNLFKA